jgi:electron transfer flavoprotein alpha subunit
MKDTSLKSWKDNSMLDIKECRNVWIFAELKDGIIREVTLELLGKGRELANDLGVEVVAVLTGHKVENHCRQLIEHGADRVILADDPLLVHYQTGIFTDVIVEQVLALKPEIFLIGATFLGRDLAPRVSRRIGTGLTADCTGLQIDKETRLLVQTRPAYGGNIMASIITPQHRPQMATVRPRVMQALPQDKNRKGEIIRVHVKPNPATIFLALLETVKEGKKSINLAEASVIVAGGRGVGSKEKFKVIEELAEALGGEVGATRDVVDAGWISNAHQVGQTGKTVRPKIYIACGISGTVQHTAGMNESETIIAINKDKNAPIFNIADYGIVADLHQVVPLLTAEIKKIRAKS